MWSGGLGIRNATQLAPSAFLASAAGSSKLTRQILPPRLRDAPSPAHSEALAFWSSGHDEPPPPAPPSFLRKSWDTPRVTSAYKDLLETAPDALTRACLLAACAKEFRAWLHAFVVSSLGLRMDNKVIRVAMGLCLGLTLCQPHKCQHCHTLVSHQGLHGLSCRKSQGRHPCHAAINDIIKRVLTSAGVPLNWSQLASAYQMGNGPMGPPLCLGRPAEFWFGMPHVRTHLPPPIPIWQPG